MRIRILLLGLLLSVSFLGPSQDTGSVWTLKIDGEIGRGTVSYLRDGLSEAAQADALAVIIEFSTPGGYLDSMMSAGDIILAATIPTIAYVNREAYSA